MKQPPITLDYLTGAVTLEQPLELRLGSAPELRVVSHAATVVSPIAGLDGALRLNVADAGQIEFAANGEEGTACRYEAVTSAFDGAALRAAASPAADVPAQFIWHRRIAENRTVVLRFYGTGEGGVLTDGATKLNAEPTADLTGNFLIQAVDNISSALAQVEFQVVTPGGSASGGRTPVSYPVLNLLDQVRAALDDMPELQVTLVTDDGPRPYLEIVWLPPAAGALDEVRISVVAGYHEATSMAEDMAGRVRREPGRRCSEVFPVRLVRGLGLPSLP